MLEMNNTSGRLNMEEISFGALNEITLNYMTTAL